MVNRMTEARWADGWLRGPDGDRGPGCSAVLSSTEMTWSTWRPFCPLPTRTLSVAPGLTVWWPEGPARR